MATTAPEGQLYTFTLPAIRRSIERLGSQKSHEHLPGYLALLHKGAAQGEVEVDASDITAFYRLYLQVDGLTKQHPFLQPFRSKGSGVTTSNKNPSGSYSGASIRDGRPLSHVLEVVKSTSTKSGVTYRLKPDHAQAVLSEMLAGNRIPAIALSAFLFRDRAFEIDPNQPAQIICLLRDWLRIPPETASGDLVFDTVFVDDAGDYGAADFELYGE